MSLRIKLPAKGTDNDPSAAQPSETAPRRKSTKRRLTVDSDSGDADPESEHSSSVYGSPKGRPHTSELPEVEELVMEVQGVDSDSRVQSPETHASSSSAVQSRGFKKRNADGRPATKKKRVVMSESESEGDYVEDAMDEDDDLPAFENKSLKQKEKGKGMKVVGSSKGAKITDDRRGVSTRTRNGSMETSSHGGTKRPRTTKSEDTTVDILGDSGSTPDRSVGGSPLQVKENSPAPPTKKRKLPPIKKNKKPGSIGPSTPSTMLKPAASASAPKPITGTNEGSRLPATARKPPATAGNTDFDLRNPSVYAGLFKAAGGSTPRSGLNRREKDEERRRELNKMRDDARSKRALELKTTFDLQAQLDKISRFEEKLRSTHSSALYPNFLAAKWREEWERERRRKSHREPQGGGNGNWTGNTAVEEGEMRD